MNIEIPKEWKLVKLGDVCEKMSNGSNAKQSDDKIGFPISRIETIWNETIDLGRVKYIEESDAVFIEKYSLKKDDILFSHINSDIHLGKTAIFKNQTKTLIHGINLLLIRLNKDALADFFNYQFRYKRRRGEFISIAQKSVNQSSINQPKLKNVDFVLPPKPTQQAIVSKIEELYSKLDKGIENLRLAQQQLKTYRQSVLKWAFEGKELSPFENFIDTSQNGLSKRTGTKGELYKVLRLADISNNIIDDSSPRKIVMDENEIKKYKIKTDDLICIRVNGSKDLVGKLVHVSIQNEKDSWAFCDHFIRFSLNSEKAFSKYFHYYFSTVIVRKYIQDNMVTSAGQNTVSQGTIKNVPVPLASLEEQLKIIQAIESRLSVADKMEESITQSLQQAEALRQSILKKAFEGKLIS